MHHFLLKTLSLLFSLVGIVRWNVAEAQFSTAGFDTVIIEKKNPDDFIYWFGEPYGIPVRMIYEGFGAMPQAGIEDNYQRCRWRFLTGKDQGQFFVEFSIRVGRGVDLVQGMSYLMPNYQNLWDPPAATEAPIAIPAYTEPGYNGRSFYTLDAKSPVTVYGKAGDSITATLYTRLAIDPPFKGILKRARRAGEADLPVLGHDRYDPTLRDAGLVVHAAKQNYLLLCSGAQRRAWIFRDDLLLAMFQYDLDHIPAISAPAYGFRIEPYMFIRPGLPQTDQQQIPFLLMMARAAAEIVKDKRYFF